MSDLWQYLIHGAAIGCTHAPVAMGFCMAYRSTGTLHVALGAEIVVAAYAAYAVVHGLGLGWPAAILAAVVASVTLGGIEEIFVYQPLVRKGARPVAISLTAFGFYIFVQGMVSVVAGPEPRILRQELDTLYRWGELLLTRSQAIQTLVGLLTLASAYCLLRYRPLALILQAMADDAELLAQWGFRTNRLRLFIFCVASLSASSFAVLATLDGPLSPGMGLEPVLLSIVAVALANRRVLWTGLSAVFLGTIESLTVWQTSANWQHAGTYGILLLILILRPSRLVPGVGAQ